MSVAKTRAVGAVCFSAASTGEWLIHGPGLSPDDVHTGLEESRGERTPAEFLSGHLARLHVGPSHFNLHWEAKSPGALAHVERFTTLAFMSTAERLHFEWEAELDDEVIGELVTAITKVREKEGMGLKTVSHSIKWRPIQASIDLTPLHELGCELQSG